MKKIFALLLCILCLSGCSQAPEIIVEPKVMEKEDFVGVYVTEWYTSKIGVDNPEYSCALGDMDESLEKYVHPGSEAVIELKEDGTVLYGNGDRELAEVGTWSSSEGSVTFNTPDISTDFNEGITISCMGIDMMVEYGWSGIPHVRTKYTLAKIDNQYTAGEYELKSAIKDGEYISVEQGNAKAEDITLSITDDGRFVYRADGKEISGIYKAEDYRLIFDTDADIRGEVASGRVFIIQGDDICTLVRK